MREQRGKTDDEEYRPDLVQHKPHTGNTERPLEQLVHVCAVGGGKTNN
ncbi:hypothetical protein O7605_19415 [Verrucosispora sp. WMMA2121]|nr:hypothetical protein [Verrucosispora sp. WMMA2121]MCZ7421678.1 hypothetical protein [Verrucosispora sp. WMMA2121]